MNKISAKSIQIFIAGALALIGFHAIIRAPYFLANSNHIALASDIFECFGLLIGIAMLFGNARAIWWAQIFLLLGIGESFVPIFFSIFHVFSLRANLSFGSVANFLTPAILFGLLLWSHSKRFRDVSDA